MRIRDNGTLVSKEEELERKARQMEAYEERMQKSRVRKEKMMQMEEERKKNALLSDFETDERAQRNGVLEKAKNKLDEEMDDVKHMNQMMLYSKVVTIRDAQIQEKRYVQQEKEEEERQLDMMMEIERLKALKMYEEREKTKAEDQRRGASVIVRQIEDRKEEEVEQQKAKKVAAARLMEEVNEANSAAMRIKEEKMLAEKLEDQKILDY